MLKDQAEQLPKLLLRLLNVKGPCLVQHVAVVGFICLHEYRQLITACMVHVIVDSVCSILNFSLAQFQTIEVKHLAKLLTVRKQGQNQQETVMSGTFLVHLAHHFEQKTTVVLLQDGL